MLDYINQLLHYIIDNWFPPLVSFFISSFEASNLIGPLFYFVLVVPISISILFLVVKIIRKFIWGVK